MMELFKGVSTLSGRMLVTRPWLRHLPIFSSTFSTQDAGYTRLIEFMDSRIRERITQKKKENNEEEANDFVDLYLQQMELAEQGKGDPELNKYFT